VSALAKDLDDYIGLEVLRQSGLTVIDGDAPTEELLPAAITA
jgi:hypothetical protein